MRFLSLASNLFDPPAGSGFIWPYSLDLSVDAPRPRVAFAEGVGHGGFGGVFGIRDALGEAWRKHITQAGGDWVRPHLHRIARGETVTERELIDEFTSLHGHRPKSYEWDLQWIKVQFMVLASSAGDRPVEVAVSVDELPPLVVFSEGTGHVSAGGVFSLRSALLPEWSEHFEKAGGGWLVPLLQALAAGDELSEADFELQYMQRHGHPPAGFALTTMNWRG